MKCLGEVRMRQRGSGDERDGQDGRPREHDSRDRDARRSSIERSDRQNADSRRNGVVDQWVRSGRRIEIARIVCEADVPASEQTRCVQQELPVEEKCESAAERPLSEGGSKVDVRAAGSGILRRKFSPHQPVAKRNDGARDPPDQRQRTAERGNDERNRHERSDADHRDDVDGHGAT